MPLTTLSQSSLQDYADCALRFQLRYLDRLAYPAIETEPALENEQRQQEGETFHRLAQQRLLGIPPEKVGKLANTPNLQRWWDNFTDLRGLKDLAGLGELGLYPELTLSAPLPPYRLLAKFDLVARLPGGKFIIYDWKTYRKRPKNEFLVTRWQTRVYRALLTKAGSQLNGGRSIAPEQVEMVYWFSDFPDDPARFPYTAAQFKRDWDALETRAAEIAKRAEFPPVEPEKADSTCAWCSYRSYCNRGVGAREGEDAEIETSPEINFEQIGEIEL